MDIQKEIEAAQAEKADLREQQRLLRISEDLVDARIVALSRHLTGGAGPATVSRTDRVLDVLRRTGGLSPAQLAAHLRVDEPDVEDRSVRATLNHLRKQGKVESPRRGLWVALVGHD